MKNIEEIKKTPGIVIKKEGPDGFGGSVFPIEYKNGKVKVIKNIDKVLHFIFSWGCGFEHLSVSTPIKTPTWEQMCFMKDIFWGENEVCMQLHPKKEDYVNNMQYCLHIWKPIDKEIPTPPSIMLGFRKGKEAEDIAQLINFYEDMPDTEYNEFVLVEGFHCSCYDFDDTNWDCTKLTKDELNKLLEKIEDWETLRKELKEFLARY